MATIFASLRNQNIFDYQTVFSARLDKQREDGQMLDEIELYTNLTIIQILTESDIDNIDIKPTLENQNQKQETKNTGW